MEKAARAFRIGDFNHTFNEIVNINSSCAEYLTGLGFQHWARSHFTGHRYNLMTSNVAEAWNAVLREAREFPIMHLVEFIRAKLMKWYAERRNVTHVGSSRLSPRVKEIVEENFEVSCGMLVSRINADEYNVKDKQGSSYQINLGTKFCSCFSFQTLLIPCPHAIAAAIQEKKGIEALVSDYYSVETLSSAYSGNIFPITADVIATGLTIEGEEEAVKIFPPASRRPPGRPRKSRILSTGEIRVRIFFCVLFYIVK